MRLIGLVCCVLLAGCSYSPEEQYRKCMVEFAPTITKDKSPYLRIYQYDTLCRFGAGMDSRIKTGGDIANIVEFDDVDELLRQFGYDE